MFTWFSTDVPASGMYFASYEFLLNALTPEGKTWVFCLLVTEKFSNQRWTKLYVCELKDGITPHVNNPSNLQFFFCNRRKDVGALSILCAGGKVPISFSNLKCCFFLFFMLNLRKETQGHRSWMRLFLKQHNLSFLSSLCFLKSFIGSTACVFSFSLNTHV